MAAAIASDVPFGSVVAVTKLHVPELRATLVPRDELLRALDGDASTRLALVTGPPGAGKTTVVLQWHAARRAGHDLAWLSLDPDDSDPVRFWGLVIAALRQVHDGFGQQAAAALRAGRGAVREAAIPELLNEAVGFERRTVLVLDDLHAVGDGAEEIHASLAALLDRLPPTLRIVVTTRVAPPLPLPRLRARGQLVELDARRLRFSDRDAAAMLEHGFGLSLDDPQIARLQVHTEGWAAGLQLAGITLRGREADFDALVGAFAAPDRNVLDYLTSEVLDAQPPEVRAFLLATAVLDRLSAGLCGAVAGARDAGEVLEELGRRNLLLEPLDAQHRWWRRHQLFSELLRERALAELGPDAVAALHLRAADWERTHGDPGSAIRHAVAAEAWPLAAELVAATWEDRFNRGELDAVAGWLAALPEAQLRQNARLWLARLWTALDRGLLDEAQSQLAAARDSSMPSVHAWGVVLQALHAFKRGDLAAAREALIALGETPPGDSFRETVEQHVRGLLAYWDGEPAAAVDHFLRAEALAGQDGNTLGQAYALGYLALLAGDAGDADGVRERLAAVEALRADDAAIGEHFVACVAALALGRRLAREGAYEASVPALERASDLADRGAGRVEQAATRIALARTHHARRRTAAAQAALAEARAILVGCPSPGHVVAELGDAEQAVLGAAAQPQDARDPLTPGELAVLALLPTQRSQREIGEELFISINTVKTHCRNIYTKLRAGSREQAVGRARELGLLP